MSSRKIEFANGEFYHIFNRGIDKRNIFGDQNDLNRFFQSLSHFNVLKPIGSIYEQSFKKESEKEKIGETPLINYIAYAINPNHFHLLVRQNKTNGIKKFMHRLGTGFTLYFNTRYHRKGGLFQGKFGAKHVDSNEYLLHLSVYINLNHRVHRPQLGGKASKLRLTSWLEYQKLNHPGLCETNIILEQFEKTTEYRNFAAETLKIILENKQREKDLDFAPLTPLGGKASKWNFKTQHAG